jgi:hypothetical protein
MGQLGDAELTRIAMGSRQADVTSAPQFPKLRSKCRDGCSDSDVVANRAFPMLRPRVTLRCILNRSLILMTSGASLPTQRSSNSCCVVRNKPLIAEGVRDEIERS